MVSALLFAYIVAYVDRLAITFIVGDMRSDLGLSDAQIGLLIGFAFALFYALCGLPLARLADRYNRKKLIIGGIVVWGLMTALSAFASNFELLLIARMGVGLGEAALVPAAMSLISSRFSPDERALPVSVFTSGSILGVSIAYAVGGVFFPFAEQISAGLEGEFAAWRVMFILIAIPAFLAAVIMLFIEEPQRDRKAEEKDPLTFSLDKESVTRVIVSCKRGLPRAAPYMAFILGPSIILCYTFGLLSWIPAMMERSHAWPPQQTGAVLGAVFLVAGFIAPVLASFCVNKLGGDNKAVGAANALLALNLVAVVPALLVPTLSTPEFAIVAFGLFAVFGVASMTVPQVGLQLIAPAHFKAQAAAIWLLFTNLFGLGLGPTIVAVLSDRLSADGMKLDTALFYTGCGAFFLGCLSLLLLRPAVVGRSHSHLSQDLPVKGGGAVFEGENLHQHRPDAERVV
ncbi:MAG: MFS transporter [Pseudomonadota bacterium]